MAVTADGAAFVAGATGYTGSALVDRLARRGVRTIAHVRPDSSSLPQWRERFESAGAVVDTTPWREPDMAAALERIAPAVVFALLGTTRSRASAGGGTYEQVDYGLTALLLRATRAAAPAARFVYLSAVGVGPGARGEYVRVRHRLEQELMRSGVAWTIARPALVTGPDRPGSRPLERIMAVISDGALGLMARLGARGLQQRWASLTGAQLAAGLDRWAYDPAGAGRILHPADLR